MIEPISLQAKKGEVSSARLFWPILIAIVFGGGIAIAVGNYGVLALLAVFGLIALFVTLTNPDVGLFLFLLAIYTNLSAVLITNYGFPSTARLMVIVMGVVIFIRYFLFRDEYRGWLFPFLLLGLYAILGTLSLTYASDYELASITLVDYLKDAVIGIIIILLAQRPRSLKIAVWAILSAGLFLSVISVFQQLTGTFGNQYWGFARISPNSIYGNRLSGPIGDPNFFAQIMVVLVPIAIDRAWNERHAILKVLAALTFITTLLTVIYTYSRGGFIALIIAFIVMAVLRPARFPYALLGLVLFLFAFQFIPAGYKDRISSLVNFLPSSRTGGFVDSSVQGRTNENLVAWNMFRDYPILGVGVGNYNSYYQVYSRKLGLDPRTENRSAHNLYLEIAAERGVFGLIVFGAITITTLQQAFRASAKFKQAGRKDFSDLAEVMGVALITYLATAIFLHDAYPRFFWVLVGICWALPQSAQYYSLRSKSKVFPI